MNMTVKNGKTSLWLNTGFRTPEEAISFAKDLTREAKKAKKLGDRYVRVWCEKNSTKPYAQIYIDEMSKADRDAKLAEWRESRQK